MKDFILYLFYCFFVFLVRILPDFLQKYLAIAFSKLAYLLTKKHRRIADKNLRKAMGEKLSKVELNKLIKDIYTNLSYTLVEFASLKQIKDDFIESKIKVENLEYLQEAFKRGQGVILYSAHFGNWEWLPIVVAKLDYPVNAIATRQKNARFNYRVNQIREKAGVKIIPKGISVRQVYKHLKKGDCLYILGDQDAKSSGWKINFFQQASSTYPGTVQLAQRTAASIVPVFLIREKWGEHRLVFHQSYEIKKEASKAEQKQLLQELTSLTESVISSYPEQWLWLHKRWKTIYKENEGS